MTKIDVNETRKFFRETAGLIEHDDGDGYEFDTPKGRMKVRGARLGDELSYIEAYGCLNISKLLESFAQSDDVPLERTKVSTLLPSISEREFDEEYLSTIPEDRLNLPLIGIEDENSVMRIIDGTHRLQRLAQMGRKYAYFTWIPYTVVPQIAVYHSICVAGVWTRYDNHLGIPVES
jgi:hypothetical protein